jgi:hypothetical protein
MKKIFFNNIFFEFGMWGLCLIVVFFMVSKFNIIGCKKCEEDTKSIIREEVPPLLPGPVVSSPPKKDLGRILNVMEDKGTWTINLNESAVYSVNHRGVKVRLNIGYCTYENDKVNNNAVEIKPEWHPPLEESRITAGLWMPYRYLSSVLIKWVKVKPEVTVKDQIIPIPVKAEITPEEAFKGIERQIESKPKDASKSVDLLLEAWK